MKKLTTELYRKAIHISSIVIPLAYRYLINENRTVAFYILFPAALIFIGLEIMRLEHRTFKRIIYRAVGILFRRHEFNDFSGACYVFVSAVFCIVFFDPDVAFVALSSLAIGDTFAALAGMRWGRRKVIGIGKSVEGSLACFIVTFGFSLFFVHPAVAFVGALATTIAEAANLPVDDNIKIPIFSGIVMTIANVFIPGRI
jgi:acyl phosphate:glycerol-3-phosphate acyltransferase